LLCTSISTASPLPANALRLYLVSFVDMLTVSVEGNLTPYVTSAFYQHGLLATTSIVASILGGSSKLAIAKLIDIWGRVEGFLAMLFIMVLGLVMKAACKNVETYAAAQTFYWTGHLGLIYVIDVVIADMTTLRNRMLMLTLNGTPTIASTFAGPKIAELFYTQSTFRWGFGACCIILVGVALPTAIVMLLNQRKAAKLGMLPEKSSGRTLLQSIKHYVVQFDGKCVPEFAGLMLTRP
jgi:MFS family permease